MFVWSEMKEGLRFSWNGAFCTFFFFLNFGLNWPFRRFRPIRPIQTDSRRFRPESARFRANRPDSEPRRCESALKKWKPRGMTRRDAAGCVGSSVPHASPHPTASDAGAAPLVPRPCFTKFLCIFGRRKKKDYKEIRLDKVDSISSIGKIFYGWIRNLGFNPYLHQKSIGVLIWW